METLDLLTCAEAATRKGVTVQAIHRAIREGRLKAVRHGRRVWLIHRDDLGSYEPNYDPPYARGKRG